MKIRIINESDWEKIFESDKSIIRVGSQISCDIQLKDANIQPIHVQFNRSGGNDVHYTMRLFSDNVLITRGDQVFSGEQMVPYEILDGDKLTIGSYRMILTVEDEKARVRTSPHIEAEMFLQKRELSPESPINGVLKLKNIGTDKPCQFRLSITGIPNECLRSGPLPYLHPGGVSTVGFTISHLMTKPAPGFHTVSINLQAPEEYYGEVLEFNQDIYVVPVFKNELILEDDSDQLTGFNQTLNKEQKPAEAPDKDAENEKVRETARMIPGQAVNEEPEVKREEPAVIVSGDTKRDAFSEGEEEPEETPQRRRRKPEKVLVIHHDDELERTAFEDPAPADESAAEKTEQKPPESKPDADGQTSSAVDSLSADDASSETEKQTRVPRKRTKTSGRKKAADIERTEKTEPEKPEGSADISEKPAPDKDAAVAETVPDSIPVPDVIPEPAAADDAVPEPADVSLPAAEETVPADITAVPVSGTNDGNGTEPEQETAVSEEPPVSAAAEQEPDAGLQGEDGADHDFAEDASTEKPHESEPGGQVVITLSGAPLPAVGPAAEPSAQDPEPETESVPAEEENLPAVSAADEPQEPETIPADADAEVQGAAGDAKEPGKTTAQKEASVVKHKDRTIPVVYGNQSFDFDDGAVPDEPSEEKPEPVRFVKGGSFGD